MIKTLDTVTLETGELMTVKMLIPPEPGYSEELAVFLRHKGDLSGRGIRSRLEGKYANVTEDRYFIGEINGRIASQLWYGIGKNPFPVASFGHVYTAPEYRKKGITGHLMEYFLDDFRSSHATAAFCLSYREWVAGIYKKHGFMPILPDKNAGPLMLANNGFPETFSDFEKLYYVPTDKLEVIPADMSYCYEIDELLRFSLQAGDISTNRVFASNAVTGFSAAYFMQEDLRGQVSCVVTPDKRCAGWSFCLNPLQFGVENAAPVFDYELHPTYSHLAGQVIKQSLDAAGRDGISQAFAYCMESAQGKLSALRESGFATEAVIKNYCGNDNLHILRIYCHG